MKLILASASPRRAEILRDAGIPCDIQPTQIDEAPLLGESAAALVRRLAEAKAREAVVQLRDRLNEPAIVIGADTAVELGGEILGKPGSADDARRMLLALSGRTHTVLTGVALILLPERMARFAVETTAVSFAMLNVEEIEEYIATREPMDKAGAYGVQGFAGRFVERIEGDYFNVVGLPLARVYEILKDLGWRSRDAGKS